MTDTSSVSNSLAIDLLGTGHTPEPPAAVGVDGAPAITPPTYRKFMSLDDLNARDAARAAETPAEFAAALQNVGAVDACPTDHVEGLRLVRCEIAERSTREIAAEIAAIHRGKSPVMASIAAVTKELDGLQRQFDGAGGLTVIKQIESAQTAIDQTFDDAMALPAQLTREIRTAEIESGFSLSGLSDTEEELEREKKSLDQRIQNAAKIRLLTMRRANALYGEAETRAQHKSGMAREDARMAAFDALQDRICALTHQLATETAALAETEALDTKLRVEYNATRSEALAFGSHGQSLDIPW